MDDNVARLMTALECHSFDFGYLLLLYESLRMAAGRVGAMAQTTQVWKPNCEKDSMPRNVAKVGLAG
jgi:hypothetical protein